MRSTQIIRLLLLLLISVSISCVQLSGQVWMQYLSKQKSTAKSEPDFFQLKKAFDQYWKGRTIERGKGYKPFRRWENFMEPRIGADGYLPQKQWETAFWNKTLNANASQISSFNWQYIGPGNTPVNIVSNQKSGNGRINCIAFHPGNPNILYAGAPSGGLWTSYAGGGSWETTTDKLASLGVSDIVIDYTNPNIIYLVTGDGDYFDTYSVGIIKSTDGGQNWQPTSLKFSTSQHIYFRRIIMHPTKPGTMFATSNNGIYKTTDGWQTYSIVAEGVFVDIMFAPNDPQTIYAATYNNNGAGIWRSTNGGDVGSFQFISGPINLNADRIKLAVTPAEPNAIYALASDRQTDGFGGLYKSSDKGDNWTTLYDSKQKNLLGWSVNGDDVGGQGWYDLSLAVSPINPNTILVGGVNLWKSTDGGATWNISGLWYHLGGYSYVHADHHTLVYNPLNNYLYDGNDGGVYLSADNGKTWNDLSDGLEILQSYDIGLSATDSTLIISGNQDNGTFLLKNNQWFEVMGGDGMQCMIDYTNPNIIYGSLYNGNLQKSTDGGLTFHSIIPSVTDTGDWVTPFEMSRKNPQILYAGYKEFYKSIDGGISWSKLSNFKGNYIEAFAVAPSNEKYIYVTDYSNIWKTTNGGESWSSSPVPTGGYKFTDIAISSIDANRVWVSTGEGSVFFSSDGGQNWTNYSNGLPMVSVNCLLYQDSTDDRIYAGTDMGIYYRDAESAGWQDMSGNLPNVIVSRLQIQYASNSLIAGTYGRGIWKTNLESGIPDNIAAIKADITEPCANANVLFTYTSKDPADSILWDFGPNAVVNPDLKSDSVFVNFPDTGFKDVYITTYLNNTLTRTKYYQFVDVMDSINFNIIPESIYACSNDSALVYLDGDYSFTWPQSNLFNILAPNMARVAVSPGSTFNITAKHGNCVASKSFSMKKISDNICEAEYLPLGTSGPFSNECATTQPNEPLPPPGSGSDGGCFSQSGWCQNYDALQNTVWFKFVMPATGVASVVTSGFDTQIAVYAAQNCGNLTTGNYVLVAANDDFPTSPDYAATIGDIEKIPTGDTLWLQVDGSFGGMIGKFTVTIKDKITTGIKNVAVSAPDNFSVYPNPSSGIFTVKVGVPVVADSYLRVINSTGAILINEFHPKSQGAFIQEIDLHKHPAGVYVVQLIVGSRSYYKKLIIR